MPGEKLVQGGAFQGPSSLFAASLRAFPPTGRSTVRDKSNPGPFSVGELASRQGVQVAEEEQLTPSI